MTNGCGTEKGIGAFVPELYFHDCCNTHDRCFANCYAWFERCNIAFRNSNLDTCWERYPPPSDIFEDFQRWICTKLARLYGYAVTTIVGLGAFRDATDTFCDCNCDRTNYYTECKEGECYKLGSDAENCRVWKSGECKIWQFGSMLDRIALTLLIV